MEKVFKILVSLALGAVLVAIIVVSTMPKNRLTAEDIINFHNMSKTLNQDLPRNLGTVGSLDSIYFSDKMFCYKCTVFGDPSVIDFYKDHYDTYKTVAKYSFLTMNGQNFNGTRLASYEKEKGLGTRWILCSTDGRSLSWDISGEEILSFIQEYKGSPSEAMRDILEFQIELTKFHLNTVGSNNLCQFEDEGIRFSNIECQGDTVIWSFIADEKLYDISLGSGSFDNAMLIDELTKEFIQDSDAQELVNMLSISQSNLTLRYQGSISHNRADIVIPYQTLKKYSEVPNLH